ncbi:DUF2523 family protein [Cupriavidus necator]|uniref:DUF2523 family protein n=1 Tax=Cupriavidus necator TaxID=106590 RepID=UPI00339D8EE6
MWAFILAGVNTLLGFVFRSLVVKFVVFFALWFITTEFVGVLQQVGILPTAASLNASLSGLSATTWYFLDLFAVSQGLPIIISGMVSRFIIRRLPVIG